MFGILKKLFGGPSHPETASDPLAAELAHADEFVSRLAQSHVWILAFGQSSAMPPGDFSQDALLAHIERNAKDLHEASETGGIVPLTLERGDLRVLPFFSSMDAAEHFVRTERWERVVALQTFELRASFLTSSQLADFALVLNVNSESERRLTEEERRAFDQQAANA